MDYFFLLQNRKNPIFGMLWGIVPKIWFSPPKNEVPPVFHPRGTLISWQVSEKSYEPLWRKRVYLLTYWHTDSGEIIGPLFA